MHNYWPHILPNLKILFCIFAIISFFAIPFSLTLCEEKISEQWAWRILLVIFIITSFATALIP